MIKRLMKPATLSKLSLEEMDESVIPFPVYGTPKFDGIRCCIQDGKALTYNLKSIPNNHVRMMLETYCINGMDGELIVSHTVQDYFNNTQSGIMSQNGNPDFKFYVFDMMPQDKRQERLDYIHRVQQMFVPIGKESFIRYIEPIEINNMRELFAFERDCIKKGFEGIILRTGDSSYKYGRSTLKQFWMVKYKRFSDSEARVLGFKELMSNTNIAKLDAVGHIKRSKKKAGMMPMNTLGSIEAIDIYSGIKFEVSGFSLKQRKQIWRQRRKKMGAVFTYSFQKHGMKEKPRFPIFKGWRLENENIKGAKY